MGPEPRYDSPRYLPAGDRGVLIEFGSRIDPDINVRVRKMAYLLGREGPPGIDELVPSYCSLLVQFDPRVLPPDQLGAICRELEARLDSVRLPPARTVVLPTAYGGEFGPDLMDVTAHTGLAAQEVVALHAASTYLVYCIGFSPGFPFLGGLNPRLAVPRLAQPRTRVPAGSVGIGGAQTGVYPSETPAGWRLIGRTPVRLYDPRSEPPIMLQPGDILRFRPIDPEEYRAIAARVEAGTYQPEIRGGERQG